MKSLTNLRKGLALVLCAVMLMGDTTMLQATQVESTTVAALMTKSEAEVEDVQAETEEVLTDAEEVIPAEEEVKEADSVAEAAEAEETEVAKGQTETTEAPETQQESEKTQVEAQDVETALSDKALEATYTATVGETTVTVVAPEGAFSEEVTLQVAEVEITNEIQSQLDEQAIAEQKAIESATAYDISFINAEGKEVEPAKQVQVSIATPEVNVGDDASVYHVDETKDAVADMSASVDANGDVAFETNHFSTYVIVNMKAGEVTVTIHHLYRDKDNNYAELFKTDTKTMNIGGKINNYNKADVQSWNISGVYRNKNGNNLSNPLSEEQVASYGVASDTELWVVYNPITDDDGYDGAVTFWDYQVKPGYTECYTYRYTIRLYLHFYDEIHNQSGWYDSNGYNFYSSKEYQQGDKPVVYRGNGFYLEGYIWSNQKEKVTGLTKDELEAQVSQVGFTDIAAGPTVAERTVGNVSDSINHIENYANGANGYDATKGKLTVGKDYQNYNENKAKCLIDEKDINDFAGYGNSKDLLRTGIVKELKGDDYANVIFNDINDPGVFSRTPSNGKQILTDYKLHFEKTGDTYILEKVTKDGQDVTNGRAGTLFFPLDDIIDDYPDISNEADTTSSNPTLHNDFFGMRYDVKFTIGDYNGPLTYNFTGDDDLWVFLDGKLIKELDMGGIHEAIASGDVDLWKELGGKDGCTTRNVEHTLTVLYMERGGVNSNCKMKFTIPHAGFIDYSTPKGNLDFTKVDEKDAPLEGATFELVGQNGIKTTATSGKDGKVSFNNLYVGTYTLIESDAPTGYQTPDKEWTVIVVANADNKTAMATLYDGKQPITSIKNELESKEEWSKTAQPYDLTNGNRVYQIDLKANFTTTIANSTPGQTITKNGNVILVLDASSSMTKSSHKITSYDTVGEGDGFKARIESAIPGDLPSNMYVKLNGKYCRLTQKIYVNDGIRYAIFKTKLNRTDYYYLTNGKGWCTYKSSGKKKGYSSTNDVSDDGFVYELSEKYPLDVLKDASKQLINKLPDGTNIAVIKYNADCEAASVKESGVYTVCSFTNDKSKAIDAVNSIESQTGTYAYRGFDRALSLIEKREESLSSDDKKTDGPYFAVYFTDGADSNMGNAKASAEALKQKASVYAVAVYDNPDLDYLDACDSRTKANTSADINDLPNIFKVISEEIEGEISHSNVGQSGVVVDTVDSRFNLLADDKATVISADGDCTIDGKPARVEIKDGKTTITWNVDSLKDWNATFYIKAKDDFLGGNLVPTNDPNNSYVMDPEKYSFDVPYVNVPTIPVSIGDDKETDFLGDWVDSASNGIPKLLAKASPDFSGLSTEVTSLPYIYKDTRFGTVSYSYDTREGIVGNHELKVNGDAVEKYHMTITYTPLDEAERIKAGADDKDKESPNGNPAESKSATGTYNVNVVAGDLKITKTIKRTEYVKAFGDPTFTFKIERKYKRKIENGETETKTQSFYRTVRFMDVASEGSDTVTLSATIKDLPSGTYSVTELRTLGFQQKSAEIVEDETLNVPDAAAKKVMNAGREEYEANFTFAMVEDETDYSVGVGFVNEKKHSPRDTDTDVAKNHITIKNGKATITRPNKEGENPDKADSNTTTDTSGRNVTNNEGGGQ